MRLLIQRVKEASVRVEERTVGAIGKGLLVLFGVHKDDTEKEIPWLVNKLVGLRIFPDDDDKMNRSVEDVGGGILIVSQFTLYADCKQGKRPSFTSSATGSHAEKLYEQFVSSVREKMDDVHTGIFAAKMEVSLINDGPVTFLLEK